MKTWPTHRDFKPPPDRVHERPWWQLSQRGNLMTARRCDGESRTHPYAVHSQACKALLRVEMEQIDQEKPLPHPGFRAGQVWILEAKQCIVHGVLQPVLPMLDFMLDGVPWSSAEHDFERTPVWQFGGRFLNREQFRRLFESELDGWTAFLAADPMRPDLAPWGPS